MVANNLGHFTEYGKIPLTRRDLVFALLDNESFTSYSLLRSFDACRQIVSFVRPVTAAAFRNVTSRPSELMDT